MMYRSSIPGHPAPSQPAASHPLKPTPLSPIDRLRRFTAGRTRTGITHRCSSITAIPSAYTDEDRGSAILPAVNSPHPLISITPLRSNRSGSASRSDRSVSIGDLHTSPPHHPILKIGKSLSHRVFPYRLYPLPR